MNEIVLLDPQMVLNLEQLFPERVERAALAPDDPHQAGAITNIRTGLVNLAGRHSQNWNTSCEYTWNGFLGGRLETYARLLYFQRYEVQTLPNAPMVDELRRPDGGAPGVLRYRANFGAGWSNRRLGFGWDGHYYYSRVLPTGEWLSQGHDRIRPYSQFDLYFQSELSQWLPWSDPRHGLRAQVRVNNFLRAPFPKYVNDASAAGVQPYGDWRGTTYSFSLTASF